MPFNKKPLSDLNRTPSPGKVEAEGCRKHSPWTAPRARKKNRSSPCKLPDVQESTQEEGGPAMDDCKEGGSSVPSVARSLQLIHDSLLNRSQSTLPSVTFQAVDIDQDSSVRSIHRSLVLPPLQSAEADSAGPFGAAYTTWPPISCPSDLSIADLSRHSSEQQAPLPALQNPFLSGTAAAVPSQVFGMPSQVFGKGASTVCAANQGAEGLVGAAPFASALFSSQAVAVARSDNVAVGLGFSGALTGASSTIFSAAVAALPDLNDPMGSDPKDTDDSISAATARILETAGSGMQDVITVPSTFLPRVDLQARSLARGSAEAKSSPTQHWSKLALNSSQDHAAHSKSCHQHTAEEHGTASPHAHSGIVLPFEAETPSPDMLAPGSRPNLDGKAPPRVPTSCRTIRRIRVNSPTSSELDAQRRLDSRGPSPGDPMSEGERSGLRFSSPAGTDDEHNPMSVERPASQRRGRSFRASFGAVDELRPMEDLDDEDSGDEDDKESVDFVLARGTMTPGVFVPGYDEDEDGSSCDMAPVKGSCGPSVNRDGQLSTFNDRLHEAVQNGDAVTVGQAWQDVRRGILQPDDIDVLNSLLKGYCKVQGDPQEAEEVVKEACREGRIKPNASTYHHMATLWTRHDQLNYPR